jgi:hypothetical protein
MKMRKLKRVAAITMLAVVMGLTVPQAFAGEILTPPAPAGPQESPGLTANGTTETPGFLSVLLDIAGVLISD